MKNRNLPHSDNWATPAYVYDKLNAEFNFNFDPCPLKHDITKWDGLEIEWKERNFINPPYSKELKTPFILKAVEESKKGKLCVLLLPVSTSTKLFHDIILANASEPIRFFKGRIKFVGHNSKGELVSNKSPMHDSMLVVLGLLAAPAKAMELNIHKPNPKTNDNNSTKPLRPLPRRVA